MNTRRFWGLVAVGAATAVGVTTRDAGFVVITFLGSLVVPRILGLRGPGHGHRHGCAGRHGGRARLEERMAQWHREAHAGTPTPPAGTAPVA
ncbi:MAG TPA: hypothetical protein VN193_14500 [Candidatus Angelobacter sp.]|jgi:hypothetical protein|nr:hypothetical protein [Candidatus Angelobacter sp.]